MIAAVTTVLNEADVIGATVQHLYQQGVDEIYAAVGPCEDDTREICSDLGVVIFDDRSPIHYQPKLMDELAAWAAGNGHEWIVAFDADEYWYPTDGPSIADAIKGVPDGIGVLLARMYQHRDWDWRHVDPQPFPKVAYRWAPSARIANGNHSIQGVPGAPLWNVLDIRELKYRSFEHFKRKAIERVRTLDPSLPETDGWHHRILDGLPEEELRRAWDSMQQVPAVHDPVPSLSRPSTVGT